jgi:hypothetical protein
MVGYATPFATGMKTDSCAGEYQDRRNLDKINCSKTIWILATNAHDAIIQDFSTANSRLLSSGEDENELKRLLKQLSHKIREDFRTHHGVSLPLLSKVDTERMFSNSYFRRQ